MATAVVVFLFMGKEIHIKSQKQHQNKMVRLISRVLILPELNQTLDSCQVDNIVVAIWVRVISNNNNNKKTPIENGKSVQFRRLVIMSERMGKAKIAEKKKCTRREKLSNEQEKIQISRSKCDTQQQSNRRNSANNGCYYNIKNGHFLLNEREKRSDCEMYPKK